MTTLLRLAFALSIVAAPLPCRSNATADELSELHVLLQSDANLHDKGVACRRLAVIGDRDSIPVLGGMLADREMSHLARTALEAIPDAAVDTLFREAIPRLQGPPLIGVINSIGNRRDAKAIAPLIDLMTNAPQDVRTAAIAALGQIATPESAAALRGALAESTAIDRELLADACLRSADRLLEEQQPEEAIELYDAVRNLEVSPRLQFASTLSAIRARGPAGLPLLQTELQSDEDPLFAAALQASRTIPREQAAEALLASLNQSTPPRQAMLIAALADLADTTALPAVIAAASSEAQPVRLAALSALQKLGDASVIDLLLDAAGSDQEAVARTALTSLNGLSGAGIDEAIMAKITPDDPRRMERLIGVVGDRRMTEAIPTLWTATESSEAAVRRAALRALGATIGDEDFDRLIGAVLSARPDDRTTAVAAVTAACRRAADQDQSVRRVSSRFADAPSDLQTVRFELLRSIGGDEALKQVCQGARDDRDTVKDAATRVLGEWPTPDVAGELLTLAKTASDQKYKTRALRAYIRIFRQFGLPSGDRLQMARQAFDAATRAEERVLVLQALLSFQNTDTLKMAMESLDDSDLKATAAQVAIKIADQLDDPAEVGSAMRRVIESGVGEPYAGQARDILAKIGQQLP